VVCLAPLGVIELTVRYTEWPRGAVGSGAAAVESAAVSKLVTHLSCLVRTRGCVFCRVIGWMVVRFVCVIRVPVCARVSRVCPVCVTLVSPGVFFLNRNFYCSSYEVLV
jgi:hypothetical protein